MQQQEKLLTQSAQVDVTLSCFRELFKLSIDLKIGNSNAGRFGPWTFWMRRKCTKQDTSSHKWNNTFIERKSI